MMDWTDRHCRYFHRLLTKRARLFSEMVVADAIIHGDRDYLLGGPIKGSNTALQLGGSDPEMLGRAAAIGEAYGYDEINLNVGCPSSRVKSGTFGACLMREPQLVARCVAEMKEQVTIPVTVKCRIGVDEQDTGPALDELAQAVWEVGCNELWVHARKAWLEGLSPKENRDIPPLDYNRVYRLKNKNVNQFIGINGGIEDLNQCVQHLNQVDGVMVGRAAYHNPLILRHVDQVLYGEEDVMIGIEEIRDAMCDYAQTHLDRGGKLHQVTRHIIGMFHGVAGARQFRRILSTQAQKPLAGPQVICDAFAAVDYQPSLSKPKELAFQ